MAYQRPMVTVDQNMTVTPTSIERDQPAFVFGPNYELHRYENAEEKQNCRVGTYTGAEMDIPYPNVVDDSMVDEEYTKVFGDNVVVELAAIEVDSYEAATVKINGKNIQCGKFAVNVSKDDLGVVAGSTLRVVMEDSASSSPEENAFVTKVIKVDVDKDTDTITAIYIEDEITEEFDSVSVSLVDIVNGVEFTSKDLDAMSGYQWEQTELEDEDTGAKYKGVKVYAGKLSAYLYYNGEWDFYKVISADLFVTYRELVTAYSDTLHSVVGASSVANMLGTVDPDNPLAMGVYEACLNAATDDGDESPAVYFMALPEPGKAGYDAVLNKITLTDRVYALAPTTRDEAVLEAVRSHVLDMSVKTVKQWRIAFVSAEVPETVDRLNSKMDPDDHDFYAIVSAKNTLKVVKDKTSTAGNQDVRFRSTLVVGDKVRFNFHNDNWGDEVWDEYEIKRIINNYTVEVEDNPDFPLTVGDEAKKIEIYHTFTTTEQAEEIAKVSSQMASRRMYNVFPSVFSNDGVKMSGEFAACAVAGLVSATEPQQPITNVTVRGIDDIPMVYQTYNKSELDVIASGGTFIICQDFANDKVYVRHQISTAYPDGNLNTAELSITKNVDNISYAFDEAFRPYYGKYNVVPGFVATLERVALALLTYFENGAGSEYGPQLIAEDTELLYIRQNELMKDHVDIGVRLGVPYPCNNIDIVFTV